MDIKKQYKSTNHNLKNIFTKISQYSSHDNLISLDFYNKITEQDEPLPTDNNNNINIDNYNNQNNNQKNENDLIICDIVDCDRSLLNDDSEIFNLKTPKECENADFTKINFEDSFMARTHCDEGRVISTKSSNEQLFSILNNRTTKKEAKGKPMFNIPIPRKPDAKDTEPNTAREFRNKTVSINKKCFTDFKPTSKSRPVSRTKTIISEDEKVIKELQSIFGENLENFDEDSKAIFNSSFI
jgi:hypothetical protein